MKLSKLNIWATAFLILFTCFLSAQSSVYIPKPAHPEWYKAIPPIDETTPQWAITLYSEGENFVKIQKEKHDYYTSNKYVKNIHIQNYKHWFKIVNNYINDQGFVELPNQTELFNISVKAYAKNGAQKVVDTWRNIGPYETINFDGNGNPDPRPTQANIYCLGVAHSNTSVVYAGAETGGIFKTIDKGLNWFPVTKAYNMGNLRDIKVDPLNENIVYATHNEILYHTTDGGTTWSILYTFSGTVEQLLISTENTNTIYAACTNGLYKSTDTGITWTQKYSGKLYDLEFKPNSADSILYIAVLNDAINRPEILKSIDYSNTWTLIDNGYYAGSVALAATVYGCKIGVTPADPNRIYAGIIASGKDGDNGWIGIYYSENSGTSWQEDSGFDGGPYASGNDPLTNWYVAGYSSGYHQGFYNFDIDVSHINADKLWIGTIWFCESGNKGGNIEYIRGSRSLNMHADVQDIDVVGGEIWIASDGGINYSDDECQTVSTRMKGLTASDYWGFGQGWNTDTWVGGRYHNGNAAYHENYGLGNTLFLGGAESGTGYVNQFDNTKNYHSDIGARKIPTTFDQDATSTTNLGLYPTEAYYHFSYSEVEWHPNYGNIVFVGKDNALYKSVDGSVTFDTLYTFPDLGTDEAKMRRFEISRDDPNYIYAIVNYSYWEWRYFKSTDGGLSFTMLANPNSGGSWRNASLTLNPFDKNELWVASESSNDGNKIFSSINGGSSWTSRYASEISGQGIKDLIYQASNDGDVVYAMTGDDYFYFDKDPGTWTNWNLGLPVKHTGFMTLPFYRDNKIRMASAKGIWEADMIRSSKVQAIPMIIQDSSFCDRDTIQFESYSIVGHTGTTWTWNISPAPTYISDVNSRNPLVVFGNLGSYDITLTILDSNGQTDSRTVNSMINIIQECDVDFDRGNSLETIENGDYFVASDVNLTNITHFTMTGWWKPNGTQQAYAALASSGDWCAHCDDTEGLVFDYYGSKLWYKWPGMADNWGSNSGITVPLDEWSYVALTITPEGATMYLNNEKYFHSKSLNPGQIESLYVGYGHYSKSFKGEIDEVTIWNRALSDDEIYKMKHLTKEDPAMNDPSLIGYYQFNKVLRGSQIMDHAGIMHGSIKAGAQITNSGVPVGKGTSDLLVLDANTYNYSGSTSESQLYLSECEAPEGKMVISRIESSPNIDPTSTYTNVNEYWVINQYESNSFSSIDSLSLNPKNTSFLSSASEAGQVVLHTRNENSDLSEWLAMSKGTVLNGNTIAFDAKMQLNDNSQISMSIGADNVLDVDPGNPCDPDLIPGKALNLAGNSGDYASIPAMNLNTNTITMSAWVKPDGIQDSWAGILFCRGGSSTSGLSAANNNELRYHWNGGEYGWSSGAILPADVWSHVAMSISPTQVVIYLNGVAHSRNTSHATEAFDAVTRIGNDANSGARTFQGEIDEVAIWNRVLTQDEIRALRHLTKDKEVVLDDDLIVYLQFNEETGKGYDKSGSRFHTALNGTTSRIVSNAPVGGGVFEKLTINSSGMYNSTTGVDLEFNNTGTNPNGEVIATRIDLRPDVSPGNDPVSRSYWVFDNYGSNQTFTGLEKITFHDIGNTTPITTENSLRLSSRVENGFGAIWNPVSLGTAYDANTGSITYLNSGSINSFGQYTISNSTGKGWLGLVDNDWSNPTNWGSGVIPINTEHVIIPKDVSFYPILNMNVDIQSINLMPGSKLVIPNVFSLDFN